jgi:putative acetyltransferase
MQIRPELPTDAAAIGEVIELAFDGHPYSAGTEGAIVRALRSAGALSVSLVAVLEGEVAGHVAFSPVMVGGRALGWHGLGPLAVRPAAQRRGIGAALVREGLARLRAQGAAGCVVLGDAAYYARFGFAVRPGLVYPGPPPEHFMALSFGAGYPAGPVAYHPAFDADA